MLQRECGEGLFPEVVVSLSQFHSVVEGILSSSSTEEHLPQLRQLVSALPNNPNQPARAFRFRKGAEGLSLPLLEWRAFRGFTCCLWINIPSESETKEEIALVQFFNGALNGLRAFLTVDQTRRNVSLTVQTVLPQEDHSTNNTDQQKLQPLRYVKNPSGKSSVTHSVSWRLPEFQLDQWHSLVIVHTLPYVKKSKIYCMVDLHKSSEQELVYPFGSMASAPMSKCVVGGGGGLQFDMGNFALFQEELSSKALRFYHLYGPNSFKYLMRDPVAPFDPDNVICSRKKDGYGRKLRVGETEKGRGRRDQLVFLYDPAEVTADNLCKEWVRDGKQDESNRYIVLEPLVKSHDEKRHARLEKGVCVCVNYPCVQEYFMSLSGGILCIVGMIHSVCKSAQASADQAVLVNLLKLLKGVLWKNPVHYEKMFLHDGFLMLSYVMKTFTKRISIAVIKASFELVTSLIRWREINISGYTASLEDQHVVLGHALTDFLFDFELWTGSNTVSDDDKEEYFHLLIQFITEQQRHDNNKSENLVVYLLNRNEAGMISSFIDAIYKFRLQKSQWSDECLSSMIVLIKIFIYDLINDKKETMLLQDNIRRICSLLLESQDGFLFVHFVSFLTEFFHASPDFIGNALLDAGIFDISLFLLESSTCCTVILPLLLILFEWVNSRPDILTCLKENLTRRDSIVAPIGQRQRLDLSQGDRLCLIQNLAMKRCCFISSSSSDLEALSHQMWSYQLCTFLPFFISLLPYLSSNSTEKHIMEISVTLKSDLKQQERLFETPQWLEWIMQLYQCQCGANETKTDLIFDTLVSLLATFMHKENGWQIWLLFLFLVRKKHDSFFSSQESWGSVMFVEKTVANVLHRLIRDHPILTRFNTENISKMLLLTEETLLVSVKNRLDSSSFLFDAVFDVCFYLLEITSTCNYELGLEIAFRFCLDCLPYFNVDTSQRCLLFFELYLSHEISNCGLVYNDLQSNPSIQRILSALKRTLKMTSDQQNEADPREEIHEAYEEFVCKIIDNFFFLEEVEQNNIKKTLTIDEMFQQLNVKIEENVEVDDGELIRIFPAYEAGNGGVYYLEKVDLTLVTLYKKKNKIYMNNMMEAAMEVEEKSMLECLVTNFINSPAGSKNSILTKKHQFIFDRFLDCLSANFLVSIPNSPKRLYQLDPHEGLAPGRERFRIGPYEKLIPNFNVNRLEKEKKIDRPKLKEIEKVISKVNILDITRESVHLNSQAALLNKIKMDMEEERNKKEQPDLASHASNKSVILEVACIRILPEGKVDYVLEILERKLSGHISKTQRGKNEFGEDKETEFNPNVVFAFHWKYEDIGALYLRRYNLRDSAIEIFLKNGESFFFNFETKREKVGGRKQVKISCQRDQVVRILISLTPPAIYKQIPLATVTSSNSNTTEGSPAQQAEYLGITRAWQDRKLSNYEYLMALNTLSGRSFNDLSQYPIFPWVLSNYTSDTIDLTDPKNYRNLSEPMGALNKERLEEFWSRYHSFTDSQIPKFLYGSHYSTCVGVVLYFLIRCQPYADLHCQYQNGGFDISDRLFHDIGETYQLCLKQMSEVKELIPEFYNPTNTAFLQNLNQFDFGARQDKVCVNDVILPPWANNNVGAFLSINRCALESDYVSKHLHEWVDLIFGYKQRGQESLKSNNVFYYLTYYGAIDIDLIEDDQIRAATELQIQQFGQCPMQLFNQPHPPRGSTDKLPVNLLFLDNSLPRITKLPHQPTLFHSLGESCLLLVHILPDRILTINALGVIEMFGWQLVKGSDFLSVERDTTPFETVPQIALPSGNVKMSWNGHVAVTGGSSNGHFTLSELNLDGGGQICRRASIYSHFSPVSTFTFDKPRSEENSQLLLSCSQADGVCMLWRLNQLSHAYGSIQISQRPLQVFYSPHIEHPIQQIQFSSALGVVVTRSCQRITVFCIRTGNVLFSLSPPPGKEFELLELSQTLGMVVLYLNDHSFESYSLTGHLLVQQDLKIREKDSRIEKWSKIKLTSNDQVLVAGLPSGTIRLYNLTDLHLMEEYQHTPRNNEVLSDFTLGPGSTLILLVVVFTNGMILCHPLPEFERKYHMLTTSPNVFGKYFEGKVKGTVEKAQNLYKMTSAAKDIAGEAYTEAKDLVRGFLGDYLFSTNTNIRQPNDTNKK